MLTFFSFQVGFTAWSSKRTPVEVFELLESLCKLWIENAFAWLVVKTATHHSLLTKSVIDGEFDELAARRRVFKVETIGDCCKSASSYVF